MRAIYLVFIPMLLALASCASMAPPGAAPSESLPPEHRPVQELAQSLIKRSGQFRSLRALASVQYSGSEGRRSFQEAVLVSRPDRLRLETLSPVGAILIVTADAKEIAGFHTREGVFYRGESSPLNLYRYTQIPLALGDFTSLLLGLPPPAPGGEWKSDGSSIVRELKGGWKETVAFQPSELLPARWRRLNPEGKVELSAEFAEYTSTPVGPFPLKISLEAPIQQRRLEIRYQDPELNVNLASTLFVQKKPENAREVPLDSPGG